MSTRTNLGPTVVFPSAKASPANTGSMGASFTSAPTVLDTLTSISFDCDWSGGSTPVGTLSVEVSNSFKLDCFGAVLVSGTWTTLSLNVNGVVVQSVPVTGNSGSVFIDIDKTSADSIRVVYTRTSGSGTMVISAKGKVA